MHTIAWLRHIPSILQRNDRKTHLVVVGMPYPVALCGARATLVQTRWEEVDGPEVPSCKRCQKKAQGDEVMFTILVGTWKNGRWGNRKEFALGEFDTKKQAEDYAKTTTIRLDGGRYGAIQVYRVVPLKQQGCE